MSNCTSIYIGIDTHKSKNWAFALSRETGETWEARLSADPAELVAWVSSFADPSCCRAVYESGPTGFGLCRALRDAGLDCAVAATSKLPRRADGVKNDRVDAEWLARCLESGQVREVWVPSPDQESLRSIAHLRDEAAGDLRRAKQRLRSFLLLKGASYEGSLWTKGFYAWAGSLDLGREADNFTLGSKLADVLRRRERLEGVEAEMEALIAADPGLAETRARLMSIPCVGPVTSAMLVCIAGDLTRFRSGAQLANYLGFCVRENSTGPRERRGGITKKGNAILRRLFVECASRVRASWSPSRLRAEDPLVPEAVRERCSACGARLSARKGRLKAKGKPSNVAKVAVAREMACWAWHIATMAA